MLMLADALGTIFKTHIVLAALLFPCRFKTAKQDEAKLSSTYHLWCLGCGGILLLVNILGIVILITRIQLVAFAKVGFVIVAWWISLIAVILVNHQHNLNALLFTVEEEAGQVRDESVMLIRAGYAGIKSLNRKIHDEQVSDRYSVATELFKSIGPLALMFINKEKNIFRWGKTGLGLAAKGMKFAEAFFKKN